LCDLLKIILDKS